MSSHARATKTAIAAVCESPRVMADRELLLSIYTQIEQPVSAAADSSRKATRARISRPNIRHVDLNR